MAIVNDAKLEALASFIVNNEVNGNCACCLVLDQMPEEMQKEVNAPCKSFNYEDEWCYDCPFWSKDAFLYWIKKPDSKYDVDGLKKPKQEDFIGFDNRSGSFALSGDYVQALEKYCNDLENILADTECENKALLDKLEQIRGVLDGPHIHV